MTKLWTECRVQVQNYDEAECLWYRYNRCLGKENRKKSAPYRYTFMTSADPNGTAQLGHLR